MQSEAASATEVVESERAFTPEVNHIDGRKGNIFTPLKSINSSIIHVAEEKGTQILVRHNYFLIGILVPP